MRKLITILFILMAFSGYSQFESTFSQVKILDSLKLVKDAAAGKVLTSDIYGMATWQDVAGVDSSLLTTRYDLDTLLANSLDIEVDSFDTEGKWTFGQSPVFTTGAGKDYIWVSSGTLGLGEWRENIGPIVSNYHIPYGTGTGLTSSSDLTWNSGVLSISGSFNTASEDVLNYGGNPLLQLNAYSVFLGTSIPKLSTYSVHIGRAAGFSSTGSLTGTVLIGNEAARYLEEGSSNVIITKGGTTDDILEDTIIISTTTLGTGNPEFRGGISGFSVNKKFDIGGDLDVDGDADFDNKISIATEDLTFGGDITFDGDVTGTSGIYSINMPLTGVTDTQFNLNGEYLERAAGQTSDYATDFAANNQHIYLKINSITGSGNVTFTGVSISEGGGVPTNTTEVLAVSEVAQYQSTKKWLEITNIDIPTGITAIDYDIGLVGYIDYANTNYKVLGWRLDMRASGTTPDLTIGIYKVTDLGSNKFQIDTLECIGIDDGATDEIVDYIRTGADDRTFNPTVTGIWPNNEDFDFKFIDFDTYWTDDRHHIEGSGMEGVIIRFEGCPLGTGISQVDHVAGYILFKTY